MANDINKNKKSFFKIWLIAVRPFAYTASVSAVLLGLALSFYVSYAIKWNLFILTLVGVICFHTAANLLSDVFDYKHGLDRDVYPTSGAIVRGLLTTRQVFMGSIVFLVIGMIIGLVLVIKVGLPVLWIGLCGAIIAVCYTGPRFGLKYRRLGDLAIFLSFGLLPVVGTYYVQIGSFSLLPVVWFVPIGLITVAILHANNWRDMDNDKSHDCKTFAQTLGHKGSMMYYYFLVLAPFIIIITNLIIGFFLMPVIKVHPLVLIVFISLPLAIKLSHNKESSKKFVMLDGMTAQLQLVFSLLMVISLFVSKYLTVL